jgi:flavin reductase (DIM6/NTAB) family NADH-FMN oxidoreductase RutF
MSTLPPSVDSQLFRDGLSSWASGVTVVTATGPTRIAGLTASAFSSVSVDPPLVLVCISKSSGAHDNLCEAPGFAVHVLGRDQEELSNRFATAGIDKFDGVDFEAGPFDAPLLAVGAARLVCEHHSCPDGGDHSILIGRVIDVEMGIQPPLLYHSRSYGSFSPNSR